MTSSKAPDTPNKQYYFTGQNIVPLSLSYAKSMLKSTLYLLFKLSAERMQNSNFAVPALEVLELVSIRPCNLYR